MKNLLVQEFLEFNADRFPNKIALISGAKRLTYSDIEAQANRFANALKVHGLKRGDRVVFHLQNSVELVIGIFGALKAGGVFVSINPATKVDKLTYILNNCAASVLVTEAHNAGYILKRQIASPSLKLCVLHNPSGTEALKELQEERIPLLDFETVQITYPGDRPQKTNINLDLACLIYTSGSTGEPKGVMSDHSNMVFAASSIIEYLQNVPDDIVINVLPLSFDYGLYQLLMTFKFGGTLVLERSFAYPVAVLKRIEEEHVTGLPGVPALFAMLLQMDLSPYDLSSLRYITNTAAALPANHILQLRRKFPGATLYSMYGLTETKRTLYLPPEELDRRPESVGIAIPGTEVWIENDAGNRLDANQVGELVVRGQHVMRGYWGDPIATAQRYRLGPIPGERLCYTGDLFRMDEAGYFYFVGRKDDILKVRGEKVAPKEVEKVLYDLEGVVEVAVVGVPDPILGQAVKAFIVVRGGEELSEMDVLAHCRSRLENFMVPKYVEFRSELPKTSSGKINKRLLT